MLDHATARGSKDDKPEDPPPEIDMRSRPHARSRSKNREDPKPPPPPTQAKPSFIVAPPLANMTKSIVNE